MQHVFLMYSIIYRAFFKKKLPGQSLVLQGTLWVDTPEHCWPPERGGGLSQYLTCTFTPPPHETLHLDWVCHLDQPPLTKKNIN